MMGEVKAGPAAPEAADVGIEQCAEAFATVRHFPRADRPAVLARFGLDEERFSASLSVIARAMAGAVAREDPRLLLRFAGAYGAADRFVRQERPRVKDIRPMFARASPAPTLAQGAATPDAPAPEPALKTKNVRFVRYDPQTGRLLHTPRWEEDDT
jgi:hypothetical protein